MAELTLPVYNLSGEKQSTFSLPEEIFNKSSNSSLVHQVIMSFLANGRVAIAHTKDRSDVRGGGKKPWKQKGTGNARAGSSRSPLWRGGGVTFGPSNARNFSLRLPKKMRQNALKVVLSEKLRDDNLILITSLTDLDGKTKSWLSAVQKLPKSDSTKLIVGNSFEDLADRSIRNVPGTKYTHLEQFTIYDAVRYPSVIFTQEALEALVQRLTKKQTQSDEVAQPKTTRAQPVKAAE